MLIEWTVGAIEQPQRYYGIGGAWTWLSGEEAAPVQPLPDPYRHQSYDVTETRLRSIVDTDVRFRSADATDTRLTKPDTPV